MSGDGEMEMGMRGSEGSSRAERGFHESKLCSCRNNGGNGKEVEVCRYLDSNHPTEEELRTGRRRGIKRIWNGSENY